MKTQISFNAKVVIWGIITLLYVVGLFVMLILLITNK